MPDDLWLSLEQRDSMCPVCPETRGQPIAVQFRPGQRIITFRCPACAAEWHRSDVPLRSPGGMGSP